MKKRLSIISILIVIVLCFMISNLTGHKSYSVNYVPKMAGTSYPYNSGRISFNNSGTAFQSNTIKGALDELWAAAKSDCYIGYTKSSGDSSKYTCTKISGTSSSTVDLAASEIYYDQNGLTADKLQGAIEELSTMITYCKQDFAKINVTSNSYECERTVLFSTIEIGSDIVNLTYGESGTNSYSYNGDGTVSCMSSNTNYVECSVDPLEHDIILTPKAATTSAISVTLSATATERYYAPENVVFSVNVLKQTPTVTITLPQTMAWGDSVTCNATNTGDGTNYTYEWYYSSSPLQTSGTTIQNETSSSYTIVESLVGKYIGCKATVAETATYGTASSSNGSSSAVGKAVPTSSVVITGKNTFGSTLTATTTTNSDGAKSYQWYYNDSNSTSDGTEIDNATNSTYTIGTGLINKYIYVKVTIAEGTTCVASNAYDITDGTRNATAKVAKADPDLTCAEPKPWTGSALTSTDDSTGCASLTNETGRNTGTYEVACTGDADHNNATCSFEITKIGAPAGKYVVAVRGNKTTDDGKIFAGSSAGNYITFNNNTWRVIGSYGSSYQYMKIIRFVVTGTVYSDPASSTFANSTMKKTSLTNYFNNMSETARNMVASSSLWYVGTHEQTLNCSTARTKAILTPMTSNIGTLSVYEYLCSTTSSTCNGTTGANFTSCKDSTWLSSGKSTFSMNPRSSSNALLIQSTGKIISQDQTSSYGSYPVVYLKDTVVITGGNGDSGTPWTVALKTGAITFSAQTLNDGTSGTAYRSNVFTGASNGSGNYTYSIVSGAPTGASINSTSRRISFPATTAAGTYSVVVKATDNATSETKNATMTIKIN